LAEAIENFFDGGCINPLTTQFTRDIDSISITGNKLKRAYAVMTNLCQQAVGIDTPSLNLLSNNSALLMRVREKVFKYCGDRLSSIRRLAKW
jgi:hypothetical protein